MKMRGEWRREVEEKMRGERRREVEEDERLALGCDTDKSKTRRV